MKAHDHNSPGNDHKKVTPSTNSKSDKEFTSYDTSKSDTATPQKVRESIEPEGEEKQLKESK